MIRHLLLIQFKEDADAAAIDAVRCAFMRAPAEMAGVVSAVEWGENNSPEGKNKNFTHCVLMTFADEAARASYLPHPAHEKIKQIFLPLLKDVIVLDYESISDLSLPVCG